MDGTNIQDTGEEPVHLRKADREFRFGHTEALTEMPVTYPTRDV